MNKIAKIQSDYIELIDSYLKPLGKDAVKDHIRSGNRYSTLPYFSDVLLAYYESLPNDIYNFWKANAKELHKAIIEQNSLKLCYSGDLSPSNASNLVSKLGLYVDTVLIPDPVFNITAQLSRIVSDQHYLRALIRHSLNIMSLAPILTADLEIPIATIYPVTELYNTEFMKPARIEAKKDTIHYLNTTFDLSLKEEDDPLEALKSFKTPKQLVDILVKPDNLIPDLKTPNIAEGFENSLNQIGDYAGRFAKLNAGESLGSYLFGRLLSFHEHFAVCKKYGGEPIYDSPNSWKMFTWFLDDVFPGGNILTNEGLVANSIGIKDPKWIGKLPPEKLIEARANGELSEIRGILTNDINRMRLSPDKDLDKITEITRNNLKEAFEDHQKKANDIERTLKRKYKISYPLIVFGSLYGYIPNLPYHVAAGISLPFTLANIYGIKRDKKKLTESANKGRVIGIMYDSTK